MESGEPPPPAALPASSRQVVSPPLVPAIFELVHEPDFKTEEPPPPPLDFEHFAPETTPKLGRMEPEAVPEIITTAPWREATHAVARRAEQVTRQTGTGSDMSTRSSIRDFVVEIDRNGSSLGLDVSPHDGTSMLIGNIKDGPVWRWNQAPGRNNYHVVQRGDRILEVNGVSGESNKLFEAMRRGDGMMTARISRLMEFQISRFRLQPGADSLGLELVVRGGQLIVTGLGGAVVLALNRRIGAETEIRVGDRILQVNEFMEVEDMRSTLEEATELSLRIRRAS